MAKKKARKVAEANASVAPIGEHKEPVAWQALAVALAAVLDALGGPRDTLESALAVAWARYRLNKGEVTVGMIADGESEPMDDGPFPQRIARFCKNLPECFKAVETQTVTPEIRASLVQAAIHFDYLGKRYYAGQYDFATGQRVRSLASKNPRSPIDHKNANQYRNSRWIHKATDGLLDSELLRKMREAGTITDYKRRGDGGQYDFSVLELIGARGECASALSRALLAEESPKK